MHSISEVLEFAEAAFRQMREIEYTATCSTFTIWYKVKKNRKGLVSQVGLGISPVNKAPLDQLTNAI